MCLAVWVFRTFLFYFIFLFTVVCGENNPYFVGCLFKKPISFDLICELGFSQIRTKDIVLKMRIVSQIIQANESNCIANCRIFYFSYKNEKYIKKGKKSGYS